MYRIPTFIPSKCRASQLHLLLESIERNCPDTFQFHVLYTGEIEYLKAYDKLAVHPVSKNVVYWEHESNFREQFLSFLLNNKGCVALFTDDCIFYDKLDMLGLASFLEDDKTSLCIALRLGLNVNLAYYATGQQLPPLSVFARYGPFIKWNWKIKDRYLHHGYCLSWDGYIYRSDDLLSVARSLKFKNPREFESGFIQSPLVEKLPDHILAPRKSVVFVNTNNCVQDPPIPAGLICPVSAKELNDRYLQGEIIDLDGFNFLNINGCHHELPISFRGV
jgi:hypothetical protein